MCVIVNFRYDFFALDCMMRFLLYIFVSLCLVLISLLIIYFCRPHDQSEDTLVDSIIYLSLSLSKIMCNVH